MERKRENRRERNRMRRAEAAREAAVAVVAEDVAAAVAAATRPTAPPQRQQLMDSSASKALYTRSFGFILLNIRALVTKGESIASSHSARSMPTCHAV